VFRKQIREEKLFVRSLSSGELVDKSVFHFVNEIPKVDLVRQGKKQGEEGRR
jgi:ribosomal protein L19